MDNLKYGGTFKIAPATHLTCSLLVFFGVTSFISSLPLTSNIVQLHIPFTPCV